MTIAQLLPALLRTVVPLLYGLLIQLGLGRVLPDETVTTIATLIVTGLLYLLLRLAEHYRRYVGIALGWVGAPQYANVVQGEVTSVHDELLASLHSQVQDLNGEIQAVAKAIEDKTKTEQASRRKAASATAKKTAAAAKKA